MESRLIKEYREAEEKIEKKKLDFLAIKQKQAQEKAEAEAKAPQPDEIEYRKLFEENMRAESEFNSAQDAYAKRLERIPRLEEGIRDWRPIVMKQMKRDREHFQDGLASGYIVSTSHGYVEFDMEGKSSHDLPSGPSKAEEQLAYLEEELTNCKIEIVREEVARDIANNKYEKTSHALLEYMQTTGFSPTEAQREEAQKAAEINTNPKLLAAERKRQAEKEKRLEEELQKAEWQIRLATDEWIQKRHQILKINFLCFEEAMYLHQKGSLATVINEAKAETEARMKAEFKAHAEAKAKADAETKTLAEAKAKALAEAKAKAEAEAKMKKGKRRQLNFSFVEREALSASTLISKAFGGTEAILSLESNDEGVRSYGEGEAWTAVTVVRFVGGHVVKCMWRRHHSHDYGDTAELGAVTVRFYESPDNGQERNKTEQKFATPESIAALANKIGLTLSDHPYHCQGHAGTYAPWPEDLRDLEFRDDLGREEGDTNPPAKLSPRPQSC